MLRKYDGGDPAQAPTADGDESGLVEGLVEGRDSAWGDFVDIYSPLVYSWCRRSGLDAQTAGDLMQDVFLAAFSSIKNMRRPDSRGTLHQWLKSITRHKISDHYRRSSADASPAGDMSSFAGGNSGVFNTGPKQTDELLNDLSALVRQVLRIVKDDFTSQTWQAFWRTAVNDEAAKDVASDLAMTPMAVRKAKSRVLHRIRSELKAYL